MHPVHTFRLTAIATATVMDLHTGITAVAGRTTTTITPLKSSFIVVTSMWFQVTTTFIAHVTDIANRLIA